jgi:hypothetical protein
MRWLLSVPCLLLLMAVSGCAAHKPVFIAPPHAPGKGWFCFESPNPKQVICECDHVFGHKLNAKTAQPMASCD